MLNAAGFDVLTAMERVSVDGDDRPEQEIKITGASVFVNPYKEMEEEERKKAEAERKQASCIRALWASRCSSHIALCCIVPQNYCILQGTLCICHLTLMLNTLR